MKPPRPLGPPPTDLPMLPPATLVYLTQLIRAILMFLTELILVLLVFLIELVLTVQIMSYWSCAFCTPSYRTDISD